MNVAQCMAWLEGSSPKSEEFVRVVVADVAGSAPREAGAEMLVDAHEVQGTIGGGRLELEAIDHARRILMRRNSPAISGPCLRELKTWPLGPALAQCCGGVVRVLFECWSRATFCDFAARVSDRPTARLLIRDLKGKETPQLLATRQDAKTLPLHVAKPASRMLSGARPLRPLLLHGRQGTSAYFLEPLRRPPAPLFIYGAGHVGRAIVKAIHDLDFDTTWVDTDDNRFPNPIPSNVSRCVSTDPAAIAKAAPEDAYHLVLTYSHALDFAICHALLRDPVFAFLGLIGSKSKRARFRKRLASAGITPQALDRLTCPIGIGALTGKEPAVIAIAVAAQLIELEQRDTLTWEQGERGSDVDGNRQSA